MTGFTEAIYYLTDKIWSSTGDSITKGLLTAIIAIFEVIFSGCTLLVKATGFILDKAIDYSMGLQPNPNFFNDPSGIVMQGWTICRDLTNIFFIFALIFIGIATILGLQNYGYKRLLLSVIIGAMLVNFSMMATKLVIDASNVLAMEFLCGMTNNTCKAENFSQTLSNGFSYQTLLSERSVSAAEAVKLSAGKAVLIYLFGSVLSLVVAFVFAAAAYLFLYRMLVLMFLIIFSPLAFLSFALKLGYGNTWWDLLLKQSFFAPAFMFLMYIVGRFIQNISTTTGSKNASFLEVFAKPETANFNIIMQFVLMTGLVIMCLVVAQKMGAHGAGGAMALGKKWRETATGAVGKFTARQTAGRLGERITKDSEGKERRFLAGMTTRMPRLGGWAADKLKQMPMVGGRQEIIDTLAKRGMALNPEDQAAYMKKLGTGGFGLGLFKNRMAQQKMFKDMTERQRVQLPIAEPKFKDTYEKLLKTLSVEDREKTEKTRIETIKTTERAEIMKPLYKEKGQDLEAHEIKALIKNLSSKNMTDIFNEGGEPAEKLFKALSTLGSSVEAMTKGLKDAENKSGASFTTSTMGANTLNSYLNQGPPTSKKLPKSALKNKNT